MLLSHFSRVQLCATPETAAHQVPRPWDSPGKNTGVGCHFLLQCMKVKSESDVAQSCPTLSDPMDCSLPGSFIHGIFQARVLEWGAIAFSWNTVDINKSSLIQSSPPSSLILYFLLKMHTYASDDPWTEGQRHVDSTESKPNYRPVNKIIQHNVK